MGCDYYGTKDDGEMEFIFRVYDKGSMNYKEHRISFPVNNGSKIYIDHGGDFRER